MLDFYYDKVKGCDSKKYNEKQKLLHELKTISDKVNMNKYKNEYSIYQLEAIKAFILNGIDLKQVEELVKDKYITSHYREILQVIMMDKSKLSNIDETVDSYYTRNDDRFDNSVDQTSNTSV
ncbi:MAG: hypothetical protein KGD70_15195 [Candidatus Lokiarchaeota archaeon]|nr:hypothetical protein [Candidatus Lokiarchaeota archaeon]